MRPSLFVVALSESHNDSKVRPHSSARISLAHTVSSAFFSRASSASNRAASSLLILPLMLIGSTGTEGSCREPTIHSPAAISKRTTTVAKKGFWKEALTHERAAGFAFTDQAAKFRRQNHEPQRGAKNTEAEFFGHDPFSVALRRVNPRPTENLPLPFLCASCAFLRPFISSHCRDPRLTVASVVVQVGRHSSRFDGDDRPVAVVAVGVVGQNPFVLDQHRAHHG